MMVIDLAIQPVDTHTHKCRDTLVVIYLFGLYASCKALGSRILSKSEVAEKEYSELMTIDLVPELKCSEEKILCVFFRGIDHDMIFITVY